MERFCAYQERCSRDVVLKLRKLKVPAGKIGGIVRKLQEEKFLDEERYSRFFVRGKFRISKWGRLKIRYELTARGIPEKYISQAFSTEISDEAYNEAIRVLILKKKPEIKVENNMIIRDKIINFVVSKGYEFDRVLDTINDMKI